MAQKKKSENSVNLTEKKKSYTREEKNNKVNSSVKKEIKEENSNKKIIIIALVLALLIAGVSYWRVSVNNSEKENSKDNEQKEEVKEAQKLEDEKEDDSESYYYDYTYEVKPVVKEETVEEVPEVEEIYYSLTFESNGGSDVETQILGINEVTESKLPTKEGWIFAGWFTDSELTEEYIFNTHLTEDITIYAKWVKHVKYIYEGTELEDINLVGLNEELPLLSKEDERFTVREDEELGWFASIVDDEGNVLTFEILPGTVLDEELVKNFAEEIILEAVVLSKFNMNFNYTIEKISEDPTIESTNEDIVLPLEVIEGRPINFEKVETQIKEEYLEFIDKDFGWYYLDSGVMFDLPSDAVARVEITEVYMGDVVTITYIEKVVDEETGIEENKEIVKENIVKDSHIETDNILVPEEKEGQEFVGWFPIVDEEGLIGEDKLTSDTIIDEDKTFVGKWEVIIEDAIDEEIIATPVEEEVIEEVTEESETSLPVQENETLTEDEIVEIITEEITLEEAE